MSEIIPHWLTKQAELGPDRLAFELEDGSTYTFSEVKLKSEQLARKLATLEVTSGTHVAILTPNKLEAVFIIHALSYLGAIAVMLNTRLSNSELTAQLQMSEAALLLSTSELIEEKNLLFPAQITFTSLRAVAEKEISLCTEIDLRENFTMMFTSGTTGTPKVVSHTYGNHWWSAVGSMLNLGLHERDKWLLTIPIFHIGGFAILMRSVIYGMPVYFLEKYRPEKVYLALMEKGVTIASLVTLMLQQLIDSLADETLPASCRTILLGGGSVPEVLLAKVMEKEIPLIQSYGMTETSSQIVTLSKQFATSKLGSAGKALFPAQVKIIDQDTKGVGEITVKGPMVMNGYFNNKAVNDESFHDGWLKTGDIGYLDEDGFLYVMDRRTDLIISGGENIYPSEIENAIAALAGVGEVAVVAKQSAKWGHVPVAFIVRERTDLSKEQILTGLTTVLARFKMPQEIHFIDALPRNASNKILRRKLAKKLS